MQIEFEDLNAAIKARIGQVLTPQVASELMAEAMYVDRMIPLEQFEPAPLEQGHYYAAAERFSQVQDELHRLHARHFEETERYRAHQGLNPDYEAMKADERAGRMLQFTLRARRLGEMVGNVRMYLSRSRHTAALVAREDTYYVEPEHRRGLLALSLWRYAEACLKKLGVVEIRTDSKLPPGAEIEVTVDGKPVKGVARLNKRMGYRPIAITFVKNL